MALTENTVTLPGVAICLLPHGKHPAEQHAAEEIAETTEAPAMLPRTPSPDGAGVFFITPADGEIVSNRVGIDFVIEGMSVTKAGDNQPNSGHHHSLSDADLPDLGRPIPANANHVHVDDGRAATELTLEAGQPALQMLLGDHRMCRTIRRFSQKL